MIFGIIALIVIVLIVLWGVSAYNGLVTLRNRVKNGWAQIDVQLKQRADLIPNLVETVKGYAAHESQVFTQVTQARASALQAAQSGDVAQRIQAENQLSRAIMNLQAVAEAYPQLQANQNFLDLQAQLKTLEEKIAYARQFYNDVVQKYNTKIEVVPTNIIAGLFHFEQMKSIESASDRVISPLQSLEDSLHGLVNYVIIPLFAFANAGVVLTAGHGGIEVGTPTWAVMVGLVVGKFVGIYFFTWLIVKSGLAGMAGGMNWVNLTGICLLGGVGFTVSLFIANLSFEASPVLLSQAKLGVLSGTVIAGMLGYIVLHFTLPKRILS